MCSPEDIAAWDSAVANWGSVEEWIKPVLSNMGDHIRSDSLADTVLFYWTAHPPQLYAVALSAGRAF